MSEIRVLGAGVSGLTAAINLAKAGYSVEVLEASKDCGSRFGGDLQGLENWTSDKDVIEELKEVGLEKNFDCVPIKKATYTNSEKEITVAFKRPLFHLIKRGIGRRTLDQGLKGQALSAGVRIKFGARASKEDVDIVATGPEMKRVALIDRGVVFKTKLDNMAVVLANDSIAHKGYAYFLVANGCGCICAVVAQKLNTVGDALQKALSFFKKHFDFEINESYPVGGVGSFSTTSRFTDGRRLYVGEAAGLQDFLLGFGIRSAIISGHLAAKSIATGEDYEKIAKARFSDYLKATLVDRFLWEAAGDRGYASIFSYFRKAKDPRKVMQAVYTFRREHKILYPIAKLAMKKRYPDLDL